MKTYDNNKTITVDYELYAHYLENADLSEDQKREFLDALWLIIREFVALGFGVHPLQQAQSGADTHCGKPSENSGNLSKEALDQVQYSSQHLSNNFENSSALNSDTEDEGVK